jgi:hypothetical protein
VNAIQLDSIKHALETGATVEPRDIADLYCAHVKLLNAQSKDEREEAVKCDGKPRPDAKVRTFHNLPSVVF